MGGREDFTDLDEAQARAQVWCAQRAGMRTHGTTQARPAQVFTTEEAPALLPVPEPYDVPVLARVKVHRDFHVEVAKALYSVPGAYLGEQLSARADSTLVKLYHRGKLVKTHPRQRPGGRSTDRQDLPAQKTTYALRDLDRLIATCTGHGHNIGIYAERILDDPLPWTRMRTVYRLLGLVRRYGPDPVEAACARALDLDVIAVGKIASMLERATETTTPLLPTGTTAATTRFARDPAEFTTDRTTAATGGTTAATGGAAAATGGTAAATDGTTPAATGRTGTLTLLRDDEPVATYQTQEVEPTR